MQFVYCKTYLLISGLTIYMSNLYAQKDVVHDTFYSDLHSKIDRTRDTSYQKMVANSKYFQAFTAPLSFKDGAVSTSIQAEVVRKIKNSKAIKFNPDKTDTSSYVHLKQASYYTGLSDSVSASYHLLSVDPYHIRSILDLTGITLDSFLSSFLITAKAKATIAIRQNTLPPSPDIYDSLKKFYLRIEHIKSKLAGSSYKKQEKFEDSLRNTDTIQARYLRAYIYKNGWPSISEGSIFAGHLARRDMGNFDFYLPHLCTAYHNNKVPLSTIENILLDQHYFYNYVIVRESERCLYKKYDISPFKDMYDSKFLVAPELTQQILDDIKSNCQNLVDYFFVYYTHNIIKKGREITTEFEKDNTECIELAKIIEGVCPSFFRPRTGGYGRHMVLPNYNYPSDKEFFYLVFRKSP